MKWKDKEVKDMYSKMQINKVLNKTTELNGMRRLEADFLKHFFNQELAKEQPLLKLEEWVAIKYSDDPEFLGEEGLMRAYEDENVNAAYKEYLYETVNN